MRYDPISLEILWSRLIAIADQARLDLLRATFSLAMRESGDCTIGIMDTEGNSVAQPAQSPPSFICVPLALRNFLKTYPPETLSPGDVLMSNDPWLCSGHLADYTVITPIFEGSTLVAYVGGFAHWPDTSGKQIAPDSKEIFEEGLRVPVVKVMEQGRFNETVIGFIRNNNRVPEIALGDLHAQISANEISGLRLLDFLAEYGIQDLRDLSRQIHSVSEAAMRQVIVALPDGDYFGRVVLDGFEEPITIVGKITVRGSDISVDYTGSSLQVNRAINAVPNIVYPYTVYPIKCMLAPEIPINEGSYRPISVWAPEGSILNPRFPAATGARTLVAHPLHAIVFHALAEALPEKVQAESGGCPIWSTTWTNIGAPDGERFTHIMFVNGGQGASPMQDGNSCTAFPSNLGNTPIEITESETPFFIERKELRPDSGGPGTYRGGLGQIIEIRVIGTQYPAEVAFRAGRVKHQENAAHGVLGGRPGALGRTALNGDFSVDPMLRYMCTAGDLVRVETPGGGGYGDPRKRDRTVLFDDIANELVSVEAAVKDYGLSREETDPAKSPPPLRDGGYSIPTARVIHRDTGSG